MADPKAGRVAAIVGCWIAGGVCGGCCIVEVRGEVATEFIDAQLPQASPSSVLSSFTNARQVGLKLRPTSLPKNIDHNVINEPHISITFLGEVHVSSSLSVGCRFPLTI